MVNARGELEASQKRSVLRLSSAVLTHPNWGESRGLRPPATNGLEAPRERLGGWDQGEAQGKVETCMKSIAAELKRDPQIESLMRNRQRELGITPGSWLGRVLQAPTIERAMDQNIERERGPGISR